MAPRRIEPFPCTGLPLLPRRATEDLFETRGPDLDHGPAAPSRSQFGDGFGLDGFDGGLEPPGRRAEECDDRAPALAAAVEDDDKTLQEFRQIVARPRLERNRHDR